MSAVAVRCDQAGCPIATEGRCLEGFGGGSGEGCPHLGSVPAPDAQAVEVPQAEVAEEVADADLEPEPRRVVGLGGTTSLTPEEADELAGDHGAVVVVVAGEEDSGKTTLVTELWARFLKGPFCGWLFAGSRTLLAFDVRHRGARASSGATRAQTPRTQEEDFRLMHLRLFGERSRRQLTLLLSDSKGELYEHIVDGTPVSEELGAVGRANALMVLIDGAEVGEPLRRSGAVHRARLLLGGLLDEGGYRDCRPIALVLSRADLAGRSATTWWRKEAAKLQRYAEDRGHPTTILEVAARPDGSQDTPIGLEAVLEWLADQPEPPTARFSPAWDEEARGAWRYGSELGA
jgi:hypothetical protein